MSKNKLTILYSRLSVEDDRDGVSGSIENQKMLLETYAERNNLKPYIHITDDGYSGTGWDRPGWLRIMEEVDARHVQNLVCKNLDRIGRDYLRVGLALERFKRKAFGRKEIIITFSYETKKRTRIMKHGITVSCSKCSADYIFQTIKTRFGT